MIKESRIGIYNYIYDLLYGVVTENVYSMNEPQDLTDSDITDGFVVIRVDDIYDESEFRGYTYGWVRVFVEAYIPPKSRGRLDKTKYKAMEDALTNTINSEIDNPTSSIYAIQDSGILSMDDNVDTNADNIFYTFIKSFIVTIDIPEGVTPHYRQLYIGVGGTTLSNMEDIEDLTNLQHYTNSDVSGDYSITFDDTAYLWICTPTAIRSVTSSGFDVPLNEPIEIEDLQCYRSANSIVASDMMLTIHKS